VDPARGATAAGGGSPGVYRALAVADVVAEVRLDGYQPRLCAPCTAVDGERTGTSRRDRQRTRCDLSSLRCGATARAGPPCSAEGLCGADSAWTGSVAALPTNFRGGAGPRRGPR